MKDDKFTVRLRHLSSSDVFDVSGPLTAREVEECLHLLTRADGYAVLVYPEGARVGLTREDWTRGIRRSP